MNIFMELLNGFFGYVGMFLTSVLEVINPILYVLSNLLVVYIAIALLVFVTAYYVLFDPRATTAGRQIFRFFLSLVGVILLVFIGTFVDPSPSRNWNRLAEDVEFWRPGLRFIVYAYVAYTVTALAVILWLRKFRPNRVKSAPDLNLVKVRHPTQSIQVIEAQAGD